MAQWIKAEVVGKHCWTPRLISLQFAAAIAPFKAGQFVSVGLDIDDQRQSRPYSLINAPDEQPLEIYFNIVANGQLSPALAALEAGDKLWLLDQANGFLVLDEIPAATDLWLLSTGTGIGPFISILKTSTLWQRFKQVILVHAVRRAEELCYGDFIQKKLKEHQGQFRFIPFVSREKTPQTIHGRIPEAINNQQLEGFAGLSLHADHSHVMLCGNAAMIDETITLLGERNMRRHRRALPGHISIEKYF